MASASCRKCGRNLDFSGDRPRFCAYCGQPLDGSALEATIEYSPAPEAGLTVVGPSIGPGASIPDRLAGYRLVRRIGDGGMGAVFEAEDEVHGRKVAVKVLSDRIGAGRESIDRFRQEGRLAATISHPRCVFVLAADEVDGRPYIVMELMTGQTLQGLVDSVGPLPVEEAVLRILDVIDGLIAAHRLGVIHRDVKPSNCFLEADGRVKVGDFGLSKSLAADTSLTRTGSFIGTPLYASAEQVKGEPVDERTDIYSVAATLHFLLTGHPPFEAKDATAALARIVSEAPRPLRERRPDAPAGLESAVLRGLERDRDRRWRSLSEFRDALLPFAPHPIPDAGLAPRVAAFAVDAACIGLLWAALHLLAFRPLLGELWGMMLSDLVSWVAYFGPLEGLLGAAVGKRLLRLRVFRDDRRAEPGIPLASVRALAFYGIALLPWSLVTTIMEQIWGDRILDWGRESLGFALANVLLPALGLAIVLGPMRRRNGYRGMHEFLSRTRTVRLPRAARRREPSARRRSARDSSIIRRPPGVLDHVGPYRIRGAVRWESGRRVLAAEDSGLGREVWVVMSADRSEQPDTARRELNRPTRSRWISGGETPEGRWDAYTAPAGAPIADVAGPEGLPWSEARPILSELAEELSSSMADGTLPASLDPEQVWVEPDGSVQLVDPLGGPAPRAGHPPDQPRVDGDRRSLTLLARVAALALEGGRRRSSDATSAIRAPVPAQARELLDRLAGPGPRYDRLVEARDRLRGLASEPDELTFMARVNRLSTFVASIPLRLAGTTLLLGMIHAAGFGERMHDASGISQARVEAIQFACLSLILWPAMAAVSRCRWTSSFLGAVLVRDDGMPPSRPHCAVRELVIWAPLMGLGLVAIFVRTGAAWGTPAWLLWAVWALPGTWVLIDMAHELAFPGRMLHDRLARTRLVPR
ncbi:protein kinase domain-containing protein [Tautonia plasticadhaerens]|uniref:Serine/threonine-protein kinase PrkC n=1 Tax=Tautonia plasticadhaerens TaxID=2527974 RepID=A0A518GX94_9BACT|nr:protein kinase [Tautonia plasticadhaerens]QDV33209.1 Serine/threonine-protein kinase PrkC [Tautonia plasticadhaerens]